MSTNLYLFRLPLIWMVFFCSIQHGSAVTLFSEDFSSGSFLTNGWTFPSGTGNWHVGASYTPAGASAPCAYFTGQPALTGYSIELTSPVINAVAYPGSTLYVSYKLSLAANPPFGTEHVTIEYRNTTSSAWFLLYDHNSSAGPFNLQQSGLVISGMGGSMFQIRFRVNGSNSSQIIGWGLDDINIFSMPACSGTPNPGNTLSSVMNPCPSSNFTLSLQNLLGSGISYQWQQASSLTGTYTNIPGATYFNYTTSLSGSSMCYRCLTTCISSSQIAYSTPVQINAASFINCYGVSSAVDSTEEDIFNVTLNGLSTNPLYAFANGCVNVAPGPGSVLKQYSNFLTLPPLTDLWIGSMSSFSVVQDECDGAPNHANQTGIWIDFNHDAIFDPSEQVYLQPTQTTGPQTLSGGFLVPANKMTGLTAMRVVCTEGSAPNPTGYYQNGETEDYLVNIIYPPCTGMPVPGNTMASSNYVCPGSLLTLTLQNITVSGVSYQWYNSTGVIPGATNAQYVTSVTTGNTYYCAVTCLASGLSANSTAVSVTMLSTSSGSGSVVACDSYFWNGVTYTSSGSYTATFTNSAGCDSVYTLQLTLHQGSINAISLTACDTAFFNGVPYTASSLYTQNYTNLYGCDSVYHITVYLLHNNIAYSVNACDSFQWSGTTYTASGIYTHSYLNTFGCDSTVTIQLSIQASQITNTTASNCDHYVWGTQVFTSSGNYTHTFLGANGCDSIAHLALTIKQSTDTVISTIGCNATTFNGQTYTASGNYTQVVPNAVGCDSTIHYNLAIDTLHAVITLNGTIITTSNIGTFQWYDCNTNTIIPGATNNTFLPSGSGNYALIVNNGFCSDTSTCLPYWTTGISTPSLQRIQIHPNPGTGFYEFVSANEGRLTVLNAMGEIIRQQPVHTGKQFLDLTKSAEGVYYLQVDTGGDRMYQKIIKQ